MSDIHGERVKNLREYINRRCELEHDFTNGVYKILEEQVFELIRQVAELKEAKNADESN